MKDLGQKDWIAGAFRLLVREGPAHVKIEPLAKELGVTKGSFYWHFKDRAALYSAMLSHWERVATERIIDEVESRGGSGREKLAHLVELAVSPPPDLYGGVGIEGALRAWATMHEQAANSLNRVDKKRRAYLTKLFQETGLRATHARQAADIVYLTSIGAQTTRAAGHKIDHSALWDHLLKQMLA